MESPSLRPGEQIVRSDLVAQRKDALTIWAAWRLARLTLTTQRLLFHLPDVRWYNSRLIGVFQIWLLSPLWRPLQFDLVDLDRVWEHRPHALTLVGVEVGRTQWHIKLVTDDPPWTLRSGATEEEAEKHLEAVEVAWAAQRKQGLSLTTITVSCHSERSEESGASPRAAPIASLSGTRGEADAPASRTQL